MLGSVGDVISGNFKVLDKMAGTMEEGRVVGRVPSQQLLQPAFYPCS